MAAKITGLNISYPFEELFLKKTLQTYSNRLKATENAFRIFTAGTGTRALEQGKGICVCS